MAAQLGEALLVESTCFLVLASTCLVLRGGNLADQSIIVHAVRSMAFRAVQGNLETHHEQSLAATLFVPKKKKKRQKGL
eukprot:12468111-Prorocentrum_lima.AAC.1